MANWGDKLKGRELSEKKGGDVPVSASKGLRKSAQKKVTTNPDQKGPGTARKKKNGRGTQERGSWVQSLCPGERKKGGKKGSPVTRTASVKSKEEVCKKSLTKGKSKGREGTEGGGEGGKGVWGICRHRRSSRENESDLYKGAS